MSIKLIIKVILQFLGAKVNWVNEEDECKTALHQSILGVCFFLTMAVLLGIKQQVAILCIVVSTTCVPKGSLITAVSSE